MPDGRAGVAIAGLYLTDAVLERVEGVADLPRIYGPAARSSDEHLSVRRRTIGGSIATLGQATELLPTRAELSSERQSHALLASMNHRAQLQIRLEQTVEGLSVAAITYYIVGLVGHVAEALEAVGVHIRLATAMSAAIPIVALLVGLGLRQIHHKVTRCQQPRYT